MFGCLVPKKCGGEEKANCGSSKPAPMDSHTQNKKYAAGYCGGHRAFYLHTVLQAHWPAPSQRYWGAQACVPTGGTIDEAIGGTVGGGIGATRGGAGGGMSSVKLQIGTCRHWPPVQFHVH
jgi:hypothetical protein